MFLSQILIDYFRQRTIIIRTIKAIKTSETVKAVETVLKM
jgi:hypothetical protein